MEVITFPSASLCLKFPSNVDSGRQGTPLLSICVSISNFVLFIYKIKRFNIDDVYHDYVVVTNQYLCDLLCGRF